MEQSILNFENDLDNQVSLNKKLSEDNVKSFRPIHYLGSKLRMLDFIAEAVDSVDSSKGIVCDLFSGSGTVSSFLSASRPVVAVDIQEYSRVLNSAILKPAVWNLNSTDFINKCKNSKNFKILSWALEPLVLHEKVCINLALSGKPELLCEMLESGSIIGNELGYVNNVSPEFLKTLTEVQNRLKEKDLHKTVNALTSRYYGGLYFSYEQAIQIDAILEEVSSLRKEYQDMARAALLSTASDLVNTIGKQFAQPLRPRKADRTPKNNLGNQVHRDRSLDAFDTYNKWLTRYLNIDASEFKCEIYKMDYSKALDVLDKNIKVIYADPPYTRDHYSRFYHVLETLCLRDNPEISRTLIKGINRLSRGVYREGRHQSPFCIRSLAPQCFENMFRKAKNLNTSLILSYSSYNEEGDSHPRVMTLNQLQSIAQKYYRNIDIVHSDSFSHSKLNSTENNFGKPDKAETLIICRKN